MSSNPDNFIDEVTEEVRRDQLYGYLKRYGWIGVVLVAVIVGGTAWVEISKSRSASRAAAFGDALIGALRVEDPAARRAALAAVPTGNADQAAIRTLYLAETAEDASQLAAIYADASLPLVYRHLAEFRRLLLVEQPAEAKAAGFAALAAPGGPYRLLAEEQLALLDLERGDKGAALGRLKLLTEDTEASAALRQRAQQVIVALGGMPAN